jgi:ribosomal protein S18 acetylase RimI-like enzyme
MLKPLIPEQVPLPSTKADAENRGAHYYDQERSQMNGINIRHVEPSDYPPIIAVVDEWWGGRQMADMLPKLFFVHFRPTSFVAENSGAIVAFLIGFVSHTFPEEAYIHFVGVHPDFRKKGLARTLYEHLIISVFNLGCRSVQCVTSPINKESIRFHHRMGFIAKDSEKIVDGVPVVEGYDGKGEDRVLFSKILEP